MIKVAQWLLPAWKQIKSRGGVIVFLPFSHAYGLTATEMFNRLTTPPNLVYAFDQPCKLQARPLMMLGATLELNPLFLIDKLSFHAHVGVTAYGGLIAYRSLKHTFYLQAYRAGYNEHLMLQGEALLTAVACRNWDPVNQILRPISLLMLVKMIFYRQTQWHMHYSYRISQSPLNACFDFITNDPKLLANAPFQRIGQSLAKSGSLQFKHRFFTLQLSLYDVFESVYRKAFEGYSIKEVGKTLLWRGAVLPTVYQYLFPWLAVTRFTRHGASRLGTVLLQPSYKRVVWSFRHGSL